MQAVSTKLKNGWRYTLDDLGSVYTICKDICNGQYAPVGPGVVAEEAVLREVHLLSEWVEARTDESTVALDDVCGNIV